MAAFLLRKLLHAVSVVVLATTIGFGVVHWVPGDPLAASVEHSGRTSGARALLRARYGLDASLGRQFATFALRAVRGDFGSSLSDGRPVTTILADALENTLLLTGSGLLLAIALGMTVGSWQGWRPRSVQRDVAGGTLTGLYAVPEFVLAVAVISVFAYGLHLFPVGGLSDPVVAITGSRAAQLRDRLWHLALPALTLALGWGAAVARQQRVALRDMSGEAFVRTARAKGAHEYSVFLQHAFRAALPPVLVVIAMLLPVIVGGAVVVESLFAWPGMGTLVLHAVAVRDYPVVSAAIVVAATMVAMASLLADVAVLALDPRQRAGVH